MKKLVVIFSSLLVAVVLNACGKHDTNVRGPAVVPNGNAYYAPNSWAVRGRYLVGPNHYFIPNYPAAAWAPCTQYVTQPFMNPRTQAIACYDTSVVAPLGQPAYLQNGMGPGEWCDPNDAQACGDVNGVCQPISNGQAFCRQPNRDLGSSPYPQNPQQYSQQSQEAQQYPQPGQAGPQGQDPTP